MSLTTPKNTPTLCPIPAKAKTKLIDAGLMHYEASQSGFSERYRRGESPQTIHVWWARRPHTAARAVIYASLSRDSSVENQALLQQLAASFEVPELILTAARREIARNGKEKPKVLDMFGGGGTFGFEGAMLDIDMYSIDSNELSVFIQKCILEYSKNKSSDKLSEIVKQAGKEVLDNLTEATAELFPMRGRCFGYLWTYSMKCPTCSFEFLLSKRPFLSTKNGTCIFLSKFEKPDGEELVIKTNNSTSAFTPNWQKGKGKASCPKCKKTITDIDTKKCKDKLVATVSTRLPSGKEFKSPAVDAVPRAEIIKKTQAKAEKALNTTTPTSKLPLWSGIVNPSLYGIETHSDFLNPRQRAVLTCLASELKKQHTSLTKTHGKTTANAAIGLLSGLMDQLIDWNCRLSMWISQNEQVGRAFSGPGIAMLWDYCETDPTEDGPANLWSKLRRIVAGAKCLEKLPTTCTVQKAYAQSLPFDNNFFDAIVTDPPYYDNIFYNALADFFFSWKRMLFAELEPSLFTTQQTDYSRELVASTYRSGDTATAHENYCVELSKAIAEASRVLKPDGIFCLMYSHSSLRGWEAIVRAYRQTDLRITSVQPLSIERKARPRAMGSEAINTCIVFVAHRDKKAKRKATLDNLKKALHEHTQTITTGLNEAGWDAADIGVAAFAQGVAMLANFSSIEKCSDIEALIEFEKIVQSFVSSFRVTNRKSL